MEKCCCGHKREDHAKYVNGGKNAKGSRYVCTKDNCRLWDACDLKEPKKKGELIMVGGVRRFFGKKNTNANGGSFG